MVCISLVSVSIFYKQLRYKIVRVRKINLNNFCLKCFSNKTSDSCDTERKNFATISKILFRAITLLKFSGLK